MVLNLLKMPESIKPNPLIIIYVESFTRPLLKSALLQGSDFETQFF